MKDKPCKACGKVFTPQRTFQHVCDYKCALIYEKQKEELKKKRNARKKKKEFYDKDVNHQHKLTKTVFNKMRVLQEKKWFSDRGLQSECISCGKTHMDWCCGHFKTVGGHGNLRYDEKNTYLQCNYYCNFNLSGNLHGNKRIRGYLKGLHERFGSKKANEIIDYCESHNEAKKWTAQELIELRKKCNIEIRNLQKMQP